ncbi:hypothetical protein, partial [uncultured Clostridium sp.]|uniref:hypothetical protein n=1 Tax=uncultured Clostridium sp. TaxID=59620 RepID=UPI002624A33F
VSYVSASLIEDSNIINLSYSNIINFYSITDLYPNNIEFELDVTVRADQTYRSNNSRVSYGHVFAGIGVSCRGDSLPRGSYSPGNISITSTSSFSMTALRYAAYVTYPLQSLKGAGTFGSDNATDIFNITVQIQNTIAESSNISFILNLANGIRYIGGWTASGSNSSSFNSPVLINPTATNNFVSLTLTNKTLSAGGLVTITFQAAIWDKYTINGIQNSGGLIPSDVDLTTSINLSGNLTSFSTQFAIKAESFVLTYSCANSFTDVFMDNEFIISYSASAYTDIYDASILFNIPDGMSYKTNSSTITPTTIIDLTTLTQVVWNFDTIPANSDNIMSLITTTDQTYTLISPETIPSYVYSTDTFYTEIDFSYYTVETGMQFSDSASDTLMCEPPILSTTIVSYLYGDDTVKPYDRAAVGDYVRIGLAYDASFINAKQNVTLFDFPPYNLDVTSVKNITVSGDFPPSGGYTPIPDNGARINVGELNGNSAFQIKFDLLVGELADDGFIYNLAKGSLINSQNLTYALMDSSAIDFGTPHLQISQTPTNETCLKLGKPVIYTLTISNSSTNPVHFLTDGFNINVLATIPSIFTIDSTTISAPNTIEYSNFSSNNNVYSMDIGQLPPYSTLTVTGNLSVNTTPIMSKDYPTNGSLSNGTSQSNPSSFKYTHNEFPLSSKVDLYGCSPSIYKTFIPDTVKVADPFSIYLAVTFPSGCLAYNTKIKDSLISTDSSNISNIRLNGNPASPSISTNNLILPLADVTNTATGTVNYLLTYNDKAITVDDPANYIETFNTNCSTDWSEILYFPEAYSKNYSSNLNVLLPGLTMVKSQSNVTESIAYDTEPIFGERNDLINYKLSITNIGTSPAYQINLVDTLPHSLEYLSDNSNGSYNHLTNAVNITVPSIAANETTDVIINTRLKLDPPPSGALNRSYVGFKQNDISSLKTVTTISNSTLIYDSLDEHILSKYQRNLTTGEHFTQSSTRCFNSQVLEYQLVISNKTNSDFINLNIEDTFPNKFTFISHDTFTEGSLSLSSNVLTISVPTLRANSSATLTYRVQLNSQSVSLESSQATGTFEFAANPNIYTATSNTLYVNLSEVGRGFLFY